METRPEKYSEREEYNAPRNTVLFTLERHNSKKMTEFNTTRNEKKLAWFSHHPASK